VLINSEIGLLKFRKELLQKLVQLGYEVLVSVPTNNYNSVFESFGCHVVNIQFNRRGINPFSDVVLIKKYSILLREIKPNIVLTYTIKPNIYGGIACQLNHIPYISNITGLGTSIENPGIIQTIALNLYKHGLSKAAFVYFQNNANKDYFIRKNIYKGLYEVLPGSGVNLLENQYEQYPPQNGRIIFLFVGRVMKDKGINEFLNVAMKLKLKYSNLYFWIVGSCDKDYAVKLQKLQKDHIVQYFGFQENVHLFYKKCSCVILPSYHEGLSNVLLEAAATGRPIITTKVPGCEEAFDDGITGFGCKVKDSEDLLNKVECFIRLPYVEKVEMGKCGRGKIEREFDRSIVVNSYLKRIDLLIHPEETGGILA
jgi:galacturonosyltransferase